MSDPTPPINVIVDPDRGWRQWYSGEIYAPGKPGRYVPNVNDAVFDWDDGLFRVSAVDYTTCISTLTPYVPVPSSNDLGGDILLGVGPGYQSESWRAFLNTAVIPHTLALDSRLHIYATTANHIKIFRGTQIGPDGEVISAFYDQSGVFLSENIPLELVAMPGSNIAIKAPKVGYTTQNFDDGEVLTVVVYDAAGGVRSTAKVLVVNSGFIRTTNAAMKYITSIHIESPFISGSDPKMIEYPINMPVANLNLMGVVTYSDGSKLTGPIDGTNFSLHGLENFIATVQGQQVDLVLAYKLSDDEFSYILTPTANKIITEHYKATTLQADGAYSVKMFAYPVWQSTLAGYRMEYFLYSLERDLMYKITSLVQLATNSNAFNPTLYGVKQVVSMAIDLHKVAGSFAHYRHVQPFEITLLGPGNEDSDDNWTIGFSPNQTPAYGEGIKAEVAALGGSSWNVVVSSGAITLNQWLDRVFYRTLPLFDNTTEIKAPEPNFFVLVNGVTETEFPIAQWNTPLNVNVAPVEGRPVFIKFLRRSVDGDLQLGISGLIVHFS